MSRSDVLPSPFRHSLLARIASSAVLAALIVGVPVWLSAVGGIPLAHLSPHVLWAAAVDGRPAAPGAVVAWLGRVALVIAWAAWLWTAVCIFAEARSRVFGRSVVPLPASRYVQWFAACLISSAFALGGFGRSPVQPVHPVSSSRPMRTGTPARSATLAVPVIDAPDDGELRSTDSGRHGTDDVAAHAIPSSERFGVGATGGGDGDGVATTIPVPRVAGSVAGPPDSVSPEAEPRDTTPRVHVVVGRETLWSIAGSRLDSSPRWREIADLNYGRLQEDGGRLDADHWIRPGWVLKLPQNGAPSSDEAASPTADRTPNVALSSNRATSLEGVSVRDGAGPPSRVPSWTGDHAIVVNGLPPAHAALGPELSGGPGGPNEPFRIAHDADPPAPVPPVRHVPVVPVGAGIVGVGVTDLVDRLRKVQQRHRGTGEGSDFPDRYSDSSSSASGRGTVWTSCGAPRKQSAGSWHTAIRAGRRCSGCGSPPTRYGWSWRPLFPHTGSRQGSARSRTNRPSPSSVHCSSGRTSIGRPVVGRRSPCPRWSPSVALIGGWCWSTSRVWAHCSSTVTPIRPKAWREPSPSNWRRRTGGDCSTWCSSDSARGWISSTGSGSRPSPARSLQTCPGDGCAMRWCWTSAVTTRWLQRERPRAVASGIRSSSSVARVFRRRMPTPSSTSVGIPGVGSGWSSSPAPAPAPAAAAALAPAPTTGPAPENRAWAPMWSGSAPTPVHPPSPCSGTSSYHSTLTARTSTGSVISWPPPPSSRSRPRWPTTIGWVRISRRAMRRPGKPGCGTKEGHPGTARHSVASNTWIRSTESSRVGRVPGKTWHHIPAPVPPARHRHSSTAPGERRPSCRRRRTSPPPAPRTTRRRTHRPPALQGDMGREEH